MKLSSSIVSLLRRICWLQIAVQMAQTALIVNEAARPQGQTPQAMEVVAFASTPSGLVIPERGGHLDDLAALLAWLQKKKKKKQKNECWQTACNVSVLRAFDIRWDWRHYQWTSQLGSCLHGWDATKQSRICSFIFRGLVAKWLPVKMLL